MALGTTINPFTGQLATAEEIAAWSQPGSTMQRTPMVGGTPMAPMPQDPQLVALQQRYPSIPPEQLQQILASAQTRGLFPEELAIELVKADDIASRAAGNPAHGSGGVGGFLGDVLNTTAPITSTIGGVGTNLAGRIDEPLPEMFDPGRAVTGGLLDTDITPFQATAAFIAAGPGTGWENAAAMNAGFDPTGGAGEFGVGEFGAYPDPSAAAWAPYSEVGAGFPQPVLPGAEVGLGAGVGAGAVAGAGPAAGAGLGAAAPALTNAGLGAAGLGALLAGLGANQGASDITTRVAPWEPAVPFLQGSMQQAQAFGGSPLPYGSPSEMVAGLTPDQLAAFEMTRQNAAGPQGATANAALENLQPILGGSWMDVNRNPYLQGAIQAAVRPVQEQYLETVLPNIRTAYNAGDDFNNSRRGIAEGIAARGYMRQVGDIGSQLANRAYETGQGATASMFGQTPALLQASQLPAQGVLGVGQQLQQQQQQQANARQAFDQLQLGRIQAPFSIYNAAAAGGRQQTQPAPQTNPWMAAIGGGLAGAQIYNMLGGG